MKNLRKLVTFVYYNRRVIGTIVGLSLTLAGLPIGEQITHISSSW